MDDLSSIITPRKPPPRKSSAHQLSKPRNHPLKSTETCSDEVQQSCDTYRIVFPILLVGITQYVIIDGTQSVVRTQSGNAREFSTGSAHDQDAIGSTALYRALGWGRADDAGVSNGMNQILV
jgi:hypothetical protein